MFVKADGSSCGATAQPSGYCWFHDPALVAEREEARKRGGRRPKKTLKVVIPPELTDLPLETVEDVVNAIADTANRVRRGELSTGVGQCLSQLFGTLLRALRGEQAILMTVKPAQLSPSKITEEDKQRLLAEVRAEETAARALIGLRVLPAPVPTAEVNVETAAHGRIPPGCCFRVPRLADPGEALRGYRRVGAGKPALKHGALIYY
jgi:hypothetical protein